MTLKVRVRPGDRDEMRKMVEILARANGTANGIIQKLSEAFGEVVESNKKKGEAR